MEDLTLLPAWGWAQCTDFLYRSINSKRSNVLTYKQRLNLFNSL